jgi:hypothetical protein
MTKARSKCPLSRCHGLSMSLGFMNTTRLWLVTWNWLGNKSLCPSATGPSAAVGRMAWCPP